VGRDTAGVAASTFDLEQAGVRVAGPLVRDRLHFFAVADLQRRHQPFEGPAGDDPQAGVSAATAERVRRAIIERFGFDPGGPEAPIQTEPDRNWFGKLSWQPAHGHLLELSHNRVNAGLDELERQTTDQVNRDGWQLSNSGSRQTSRTAATRLRVLSTFGRATNELQAGYQTSGDDIEVPNRVPLFLVQADVSSGYIAAGSVDEGPTSLRQRLIELTDNLTVPWHGHQLTAGVQSSLYHVRDDFFSGSLGIWTFPSVDALEALAPIRYEVARPLRPGGPVADFHVEQLGVYGQDRWLADRRLELTLGLRWDVPFIDRPPTNPELLASEALGHINTGRFPGGHGVLSPRLGVRVEADRRTTVRAGAGVFVGRPPLVWVGQAFLNTGRDQATLVCGEDDGVPAPTADVDRLPQACLNTAGVPTPPPTASYFEPTFRFPETVKLAVGLDRELPDGWAASADLIRTWARHQLYIEDVNLVPDGPDAEGRVRYSQRKDDRSGAIYRFSDRSRDRSISASATVVRRFGGGRLSVGYTWSRSEDVLATLHSTSRLLLQNTALDGSLADRRLRPSAVDVPHRIAMTGWLDLPSGFGIGVIYTAQSGTPYAYTVNRGDVNGDRMVGNDLIYVPRDPSDILLADPTRAAELDSFIAAEPCLARQRGRIMARNSCRNPWTSSLDVRASRGWSVLGRPVSLGADVFNLPNLLDGDWGLARQSARLEELPLLQGAGFDPAQRRPIYAVPKTLPALRQVLTDASRWRIQLEGRVGL
jgi:hypothetical protein